MDEATTILFEDYLEGILSEEDRFAFENRLEEDAEFASNFHTYKDIRDHLSHEFSEERNEFKDQLNTISDGYFEKGTSEEKETKVIRFRPWQYGIAASIALLIGFFIFQNAGSLEHGDFTFSEQITLTERSDSSEALKQAEDAFNEGNYEVAIPFLSAALENNPDNPELLFYKALAHDALEEYTAADSLYERLRAGNSLFKHKAAFYKAISLWKRDNIEGAQSLLNTIPENAPEYKDAQKILKKL